MDDDFPEYAARSNITCVIHKFIVNVNLVKYDFT